MKKISVLLFVLLLIFCMRSFAQNDGGVSIGKGSNPANQKSILELVSKTKGLLIPRMTDTERNAIFSGADQAAKGLMVFDDTRNAFYFWDGSAWKAIASGNVMTVSGTPSTPGTSGELVLDTQNSLLYIYDGGKWLKVGAGNTNTGLASEVNVIPNTTVGLSSVNVQDALLELQDEIKTASGGGMNSVVHDAALSGNGTDGIPLTIAPGGISGSHLKDAAVTAAKISGGGNNKVLTTDGAGTTVWADKSSLGGSGGSSSSVITDKTLTGDGTASLPLGLRDGMVTASKISGGGSDKILTTDATGTAVWIDKSSLGGSGGTSSSVITDKTLTGDGTALSRLGLATDAVTSDKIGFGAVTAAKIDDDAVTSSKIHDFAITTSKIEDGAVSTTKLGFGAATSEKIGYKAITTEKIEEEAVTSSKILDGTIQAKDLGDMNAQDGYILQWKGGYGWLALPGNAGTGGGITRITPGTGLSGGGSVGDVTLGLADGGVSTSKIADGAIQASKLGQMGATASGQVLQWDGSVWKPATVSGGTGSGTNLSATTTGSSMTINSSTGTSTAVIPIGSTTSAGLMTATDKVKLDAISGNNTGDQDLSLYALKANVLERTNTGAFTPTGAYQPATKKYVDDQAGVLSSGLDGKVDKNANILAGTATKITYDSKGLVTGGVAATTADITSVTDRRYVTEAQLALIGNTSGINTGDETAAGIRTKLGITTLTGSNTGDQNAGSVPVTPTGTLTSTNVQAALIELQGEITAAASGGLTSVSTDATLTGNGNTIDLGIATGGVTTAKIADKAVTLTKMADLAPKSLIGNSTTAAARPEAITVGSGLTLNGGVLSAGGTAGATGGDVAIAGQTYLSLSGQTLTAGAVDLSGSHATGILAATRFPALSGDVTTTAGSLTTTIGDGKVTNVKLASGIDAAKLTVGVLPLSSIPTTLTGITSLNGLVLTPLATGFSISGGTSPKTLTLADNASVSGTNTGDQTLSMTGNTISLSGGGSVTGIGDITSVVAGTGLTGGGTTGDVTLNLATNAVGASALKGSSGALGNGGGNGFVLQSNGDGTFSWKDISSGVAADPSSLALATGQFYIGDGSSKASAIAKSAIPLSGFGAAEAPVDLGNKTISNLANPASATDAVNKAYVDAKVPASAPVNSGQVLTVNASGNPTWQPAGTVRSVSVTPNAGVSGVVTDPTTTPAIAITLGDITPSKITTTGAISAGSISTGALTTTGTISGTNLSGTNTGDQGIAITGSEITGTPNSATKTTSIALSINDNSITSNKIVDKTITNSDIADATITPANLNITGTASVGAVPTYNASSGFTWGTGGGTNIGYTPATGILTSSNGTGFTFPIGSTSTPSLMTASDKTKLDGIAASANNYALPIASAGALGGIKVGTNLTIDGSGVLSATSGGLTAINPFTLLGNNTGSSAVPTALNATDVRTLLSISNVDNTTDAAKPVSTATQNALTLKQDVSNLSSNVTTDAASTTKYPSVSAIKTYVDAQVSAGASSATTSSLGIIKLAGDLSGTALLPSVATVGGSTAAAVNTATVLANNATTSSTPNTLVKRDASGNIGGNITGSAATVTAAAQPAITSLGTLSGLTVTGTISGSISGNAATATTATTATNIAGGAAGQILYQSAAGITSKTAAGISGQVLTSNGAGAPTWTNSGTGDMTKLTYDPAGINQQLVGTTATQTLTNKELTSPKITTPTGLTKSDVQLGNVQNVDQTDASNLTSGTVATARLGTGTANATTFLAGDGTWKAAGGSSTTDLSYTATASQGTVYSSTGNSAIILGATTSAAGLLNSTDKTKLDKLPTVTNAPVSSAGQVLISNTDGTATWAAAPSGGGGGGGPQIYHAIAGPGITATQVLIKGWGDKASCEWSKDALNEDYIKITIPANAIIDYVRINVVSIVELEKIKTTYGMFKVSFVGGQYNTNLATLMPPHVAVIGINQAQPNNPDEDNSHIYTTALGNTIISNATSNELKLILQGWQNMPTNTILGVGFAAIFTF